MLVCCTCGVTTAQKLSIGLRGGINYTTPPIGMNDAGRKVFDKLSGNISTAAALRVMFDTKRFQVGLSYERARLSYTYSIAYKGTLASNVDYRANTGVRQLIVVANLKTRLPKSYLYYGLNAGITSIRLDNTSFDVSGSGLFSTLRYPGSYTFNSSPCPVFGLQVGYNYSLTKHFSVSGELCGRYIMGDITSSFYDINANPVRVTTTKGLLYFPVTAGISYTF